MLESVIVAFHLLTAICIICLVLLQQGKGAEAGASFGAGASATMFGSAGSATFFSKVTAILAAIFFVTSLGLGYFAKNHAKQLGVVGLPDITVSEPAIETKVLDVQGTDLPTFDGQNSTNGQEQKSSDVPIISDDIPQINNQSDNKDLPDL